MFFQHPMCAPDVFQLQQHAAHNRSADPNMVARLQSIKRGGKKEKNPSQITPSHPTPSQNFFFVVVKVAAEAAEAAVESWPLSLFHSRLSVSSEVSQDNWFPQALFFISFFFSLLNAAFGAVYYTCLPRFIADGRGWGTFAQISLF